MKKLKLEPKDIIIYYDEPQLFSCDCEDGKLYLCLRDDTVYPEYITVETNEQEVEDVKSERIDFLPLIEGRNPKYRTTWIESDLIFMSPVKSRRELRHLIESELERQGPDADLNHIDTSGVKDMKWLFMNLDIRNIKINQWNVSNVWTMEKMFFGCKEFNCDLSRWDVSNVITTGYMFYGCEVFESDLSGWNTSNIRRMYSMFHGCTKFNSDLSKWNIGKVKGAMNMFEGCEEFESDLSSWDFTGGTVMEYKAIEFFRGCPKMLANPKLLPNLCTSPRQKKN